MAALQLRRARRSEAKLRAMLSGRSGAGKTYTAITVGLHLARLEGGPLVFIDSENGSADKYADVVGGMEFDVIELDGDYAPTRYREAIGIAVKAGAAVIVIDSISHGWAGEGGVLDIVDAEQRSGRNRDKQAAWAKGTPEWNKLIEAIVNCPAHVIVCARAKTVWDTQDENGKTKRVAVGTKPIARDEFEYEFDFFGVIERDGHILMWEKNRSNGAVRDTWKAPGEDLADAMFAWLKAGGADIEQRVRDLAALRPEGLDKQAYADLLIGVGIKGRDDIADDAKFQAAREALLALHRAEGEPGGDEPQAGPDEATQEPEAEAEQEAAEKPKRTTRRRAAA